MAFVLNLQCEYKKVSQPYRSSENASVPRSLSQHACSVGGGPPRTEVPVVDASRGQGQGEGLHVALPFYPQSYLDTGHVCGRQIWFYSASE